MTNCFDNGSVGGDDLRPIAIRSRTATEPLHVLQLGTYVSPCDPKRALPGCVVASRRLNTH